MADLNSYLQENIVSTINTKDLKSGQTDRFTAAAVNVAAAIRAAIQSYPGFVVSATANSVPPELRQAACYLTLVAMQNSCPALVLSDDQRKRFEKAWDDVERVRKGELRPSLPDNPTASTVQGHPVLTVISKSERLVTPETMRGI